MYTKFLILKPPNVSNKDALSIRKRLPHSAINKRNKELQHLSKRRLSKGDYNSNYPRKNLIYLKQVYTFQSYQIKFENPKSSLHFEKIHCSFLNNVKCGETKSQIKAHLSYFVNTYFYNDKPSPGILRQHHVLRKLRKNKDIVIMKPD